MLHGMLIILYCGISILGSIVYYVKEELQMVEQLALLFFTVSHLFLLVLGTADLFYSVSVFFFLLAILLALASRVVNGKVLYGKNNWRHYMVTGFFMGALILLFLYDI